MSNITELNKDMEKYVLQAGRPRAQHYFKHMYGDKAKPLVFVHVSDVHNDIKIWSRMVEYINHYSEYISFGLHTGDYCGGTQDIYTDMYKECEPCIKSILNCNGNHDCVIGDEWTTPAPKKSVHEKLFNHTENWGAVFMDTEYSMSYYKDFQEENIRLIVLDSYYNIWETRRWLYDRLHEALELGFHVITAMHEPTDYVVEDFGVIFNSKDDYQRACREYEIARESVYFDHRDRVLYEDVIEEFINRGGNYICNLAGHDHHDIFGITRKGVLNVVVENATSWDRLGDANRIEGTKSYDCFNVVAVDTDMNLLKIIRIGSNVDHYLREKNVLCFDYKNKKIIYQK